MAAGVVDITLSDGTPFVRHDPGFLEYCIGFMNRTDYITYEFGAYDRPVIMPGVEVTFKVQPSVGESFTFVGVPYAMMRTERANLWRATFVSKHWKGLMSMVPTYGKGLTSDIIASIYAAAKVPRVGQLKPDGTVLPDNSNVSMDSMIFPSTVRRSQAISYLLNRSTTSGKGFLLATVVGDQALIVDVKKGRSDVRDVYYQVLVIKDERKRVDMLGGLNSEVASDSEGIPMLSAVNPGTNEIAVKHTYNISNDALAGALLKVKQARAYYSGYVAVVSVLGWTPLIGRNVVVAEGDVYRDLSWMKQLDDGKYFVTSQTLRLDFKESMPKMQCSMMLIDDKVQK